MKSFTSILVTLGGVFVAAQELCGSPEPPADLRALVSRSQSGPRNVAAEQAINTYIHVITTEAKEGQYPRSMIDQQIEVLNDRFVGSGFTFATVSVDYNVNDTWAFCGVWEQCEFDFKAALRQGTYADLNLYYLSDLSENMGVLGYAFYPESDVDEATLSRDGVVNLAGTLPGAEFANYDQGLTTVHEVGHWLGLFHTFQGNSCTGEGDLVADTPQQLEASAGCPTSSDTCPDSPGLDPIHNYMDYTIDVCKTEFTPGQIARAQDIFATLRLGK
ncbi:extracellular metalloprotease-1 [Diaporthe amygdali]|uniref:extracellular metalloprotease-1 n=1 Tax=Phomopsis amygdali TaxID=1214568 RepID=UPI0022FE9C49|nr:extracellular metalloprotease-1 [Diaporthe amygdali]KAJ0119644.1 extracellular metalloprotease-1 [Diaporthe amygdali]